MKRALRRAAWDLALAAAAVVAMALPSVPGYWLPGAGRAFVAAAGLFVLPGMVLERLLSPTRPLGVGRPALWFVLSLALGVAALGAALLFGGDLEFAAGCEAAIVCACALVAAAAHLLLPKPGMPHQEGSEGARTCGDATAGMAPRAGTLCLAAAALGLAAFDTYAAWRFTATGSIDRWWYLAYIRQWLNQPAIGFGEPFFGTPRVVPRFGFNAWMLSLAEWAELSGVDPVWLYEKVCPLLLVPLAFSAVAFLARALFGTRRIVLAALVGAGLLWAGGTFVPAGTRMPEDKIVAWLVIMPVTLGALVALARSQSKAAAGLLGACLLVQATIHPLVYALVLVAGIPFVLWAWWQRQTPSLVALVALSLLLAGAVHPARVGGRARADLLARGARIEKPGNPIVRVHLGRNRLLFFSGGSYVVHPRLLARPLLLLALSCLLFVWRRAPIERALLVPATTIPLVVAFVPPAPWLAGQAVVPWMVYRILWAIPFPLLLAVGLEAAARRGTRWLVAALAALALVSFPWVTRAWSERSSSERLALELPAGGPLRRAVEAIASLPETAVIAAPPEISERIPALTGRYVLAVSDRGTLVFAPSPSQARARMFERAAIMAGLPGSAAQRATHALYAPGRPAARRCARLLFEEDGFALCELTRPRGSALPPGSTGALASLAARAPASGLQQPEQGAGQSRNGTGRYSVALSDLLRSPHRRVPVEAAGAGAAGVTVSCNPPPVAGRLWWPRPGPWSAAPAQALCTVRRRTGQPIHPRELLVEALAPRAEEKLIVHVYGNLPAGRRAEGAATFLIEAGHPETLPLPATAAGVLHVEITPVNLPHLRLANLRLAFD